MKKPIILFILLLSTNVFSQDCSKIEDSLERLRCYDGTNKISQEKETSVEKAPNDEVTIAREKIKQHLKDPFSAVFSAEKVIDGTGEKKVVCGKVNAKNSYGGFTGFRRYFVSGNFFRLDGFDNRISSDIWDLYCGENVPKKAIKKWSQYYSGSGSVFATTSKNATLFMRCNGNMPVMYQDLPYDVMPEEGRGFLGVGNLRPTSKTVMRIVGRPARWRMIDKDTLGFKMGGRSMKHIANILKAPSVGISGTSASADSFANAFEKDGFKESLQELKAVCPNSAWDKYLGDLLQ